MSLNPPWVTCPAGSWTRIYNGLNWFGVLDIFARDLALHPISYRYYSAAAPYWGFGDIVVPTMPMGMTRILFAPTPGIEFFINPSSPSTDFRAL